MRPDMAKKVVEGGRAGGRNLEHRPRRAGEEMEHYPTHQGMRRPWKDRKQLTDTLAPLYRFLERQVGRPWDKVWSEIAATMDFRHVLGFHIKSHLDQKVDQHVRMIDGRPHEPAGHWRWREGPDWLPLRPGALYVHPTNGLLCRAKGVKARHRPHPPGDNLDVKPLSPGEVLERINGIWYHVQTVTTTVTARDFWTQQLREETRTSTVKTQLGKKALRRHGVRNETAPIAAARAGRTHGPSARG